MNYDRFSIMSSSSYHHNHCHCHRHQFYFPRKGMLRVLLKPSKNMSLRLPRLCGKTTSLCNGLRLPSLCQETLLRSPVSVSKFSLWLLSPSGMTSVSLGIFIGLCQSFGCSGYVSLAFKFESWQTMIN